MTNRPVESWERDFFERFGANTIWTVPSRENVETILNIHSFIHQQLTLARADERGKERERIYNEIYHSLPTGEVTAWDWVKWSHTMLQTLNNNE